MTTIERLKQISTRDLAVLGVQNVAYVKPVMVDGVLAFAIHAADGTELALAPTREHALALIRKNDLEPVSVH